MKNDEPPSDSGDCSRGPQPEVLAALEILTTSCTEEMWNRFLDDLSCHAAELVRKFNWRGSFRPDSNSPNDPAGKHLNSLKAKRLNQVALDAYGKVVDGSWKWDPTKGQAGGWKDKYPDWPPELVSLFGFLWRHLGNFRAGHIRNLWELDCNKYDAPPAAADEEQGAPASADEKETAVSAYWDKETLDLDHAAGTFSNALEFNPQEVLAIKEDWSVVLNAISISTYEDKELIMKIAEICSEEIRAGDEWEGRRKRNGYVQEKGARPRELVEEIFGRDFQKSSTTDPSRTRINNAKEKLRDILAQVGTDRCIEAGIPEFRLIHQYFKENSTDGKTHEEISHFLAGLLGLNQQDATLLLKRFVEHWTDWFERHRYFREPELLATWNTNANNK